MFAEKRDPLGSPDENLGRWILGGVVLLVLAGGGWYWQKHRSEKAEAPVVAAKAPAPAQGKVKNPIVAPDDIDPNLSATEQVATLIGTPRFEALLVPDDFVKKVVATVDDSIAEAFVSGADGTKVAFLSKPTSWSHKGKDKHDAPMSGKTWYGPVEVDQSSGAQQIQLGIPVLDGGKPIGSIVIGLKVTKLL